MPWKANAKMSQIKLKRLSFRVRWANVAKGGLAECLKELLRKQTQLPDRQTDPETERLTDAKTDRRIERKTHWQAARMRQRVALRIRSVRWRQQKNCLPDAIKTEAAPTPTRWHAQRYLYGRKREIWQGRTHKTKQNIDAIAVCVCVCVWGGGRWKNKTCKAKATRHHTRLARGAVGEGVEDCHMKGRSLCLSAAKCFAWCTKKRKTQFNRVIYAWLASKMFHSDDNAASWELFVGILASDLNFFPTLSKCK